MKKPAPIMILLLTAVFLITASGAAVAEEIIERVSVDSSGNQGNRDSLGSSISDDGRYVAFSSWAFNFVIGDENYRPDIFLRDRRDGQTTPISVNYLYGYGGYTGYGGYLGQDEYVEEIGYGNIMGDSGSFRPAISADGRYVVFWSKASNLIPSDWNDDTPDVFLHEVDTSQTTALSVDPYGYTGSGPSYDPCISADGRYVAYSSEAENLYDPDENDLSDIFIRDTLFGYQWAVSVVPEEPYPTANGPSHRPSISADGKRIAFESSATNLVKDFNDNNGCTDIFVYDSREEEVVLVSVNSSGEQANAWSTNAAISADGRYVAFFSWATNLLGEGDPEPDSYAPEAVDEKTSVYSHGNIFVHDLETGETTSVTATDDPAFDRVGYGGRTYISEHGRYVAFGAREITNGAPPDPQGIIPEYYYNPEDTEEDFTEENGGTLNQIYVRDRLEETTTMASVNDEGTPGNSNSHVPTLSDYPLYTSFVSYSDNLVDDDSCYGYKDVFIRGPVPVIDAIDPAFGFTFGGTEVTISGSGFVPGADLYFDDIPLGDMAVLNSTTITALVPSHDLGFVDVTVVNPDGYSDTLDDGFEYICPVPAAPDDLAAYKNGLTDVFLSWNDNSDDEDGFVIERKDGEEGAWILIDTVDSDVSTYEDNDLEQMQLYFYRVYAYNECGDSEYSNPAVMAINYIPLPGEVIGPNFPPIVDAGEDRLVCVGATVALDGSGSWDFNGEDVLTFEWSIVSAPAGSTASLTSTDTPETSLVTVVPGEYVVQLTVSDGDFVRSVTVTITVSEDCSGSATNQISGAASGGCFVATAAYGSADSPVVQSYILLRDRYLLNTAWGRTFISLYYAHSPRFADIISQSEALRAAVRVLISPWALLLVMGVTFATATVLGARRS